MKAYLFLANGFEEMEVVYPISILRTAGINVLTVSVEGSLSVMGSHGVCLMADVLFSEGFFADADIIILPGGQPGTERLNKFSPLKPIIEKYAKQRYIAAICAAPSILGEMGLLCNRKATCYPGYEKKMEGAILGEAKVVVDGNIITAVGPGVAKDFALAIVKELCSCEVYETVSKAVF